MPFHGHFVFVCFSYRYSASVGATHMHTSAKANKGVDEIFAELTSRKCLEV